MKISKKYIVTIEENGDVCFKRRVKTQKQIDKTDKILLIIFKIFGFGMPIAWLIWVLVMLQLYHPANN